MSAVESAAVDGVSGWTTYGPLGVIAVVFLIAIVYLWRDAKSERGDLLKKVDAAQAAQIRELKEMQAQLIELAKQSNVALSNVAGALDRSREASVELRVTLKEFGEELREYGDELRRPRRGG